MNTSTKTVGENGFQVEIDTTQNTGGLYKTGGRAWVNKPGKEIITKRNYIKGKWAKLEQLAVGRNITVQINDTICSELKNDKGRIKGLLRTTVTWRAEDAGRVQRYPNQGTLI